MTAKIAAPDSAAPVTMLELFFDLVFVFLIAQLTSLLTSSRGWLGYGRAALVLLHLVDVRRLRLVGEQRSAGHHSNPAPDAAGHDLPSHHGQRGAGRVRRRGMAVRGGLPRRGQRPRSAVLPILPG